MSSSNLTLNGRTKDGHTANSGLASVFFKEKKTERQAANRWQKV